jgi:hypothetical protein
VWRRLPLVALTVFLAIPPLRFAVLTATAPELDFSKPDWKAREALIARARVLVSDPPNSVPLGGARTVTDVSCRFVPKPAKATTAKFDCRLENGDVVKVKYGRSRERQGEVAATGLLAALGFGADHVSTVERVRCYGCPPWPFQLRLLAEQFLLAPLVERTLDYGDARDFRWVSIERKIEGRAIEIDDFEGWDWRELSLVKSSAGGASAAELDALRLIAVFLAHWDNKATNHRLLCVGDSQDTPDPAAPCDKPLLMLQDVGATFGPGKVIFKKWAPLPIWKDPGTCLVSMETLPYDGILFPPVRISEGGRALLANRLRKLSTAQVHALFQHARFPDPVTGEIPARDLTPWVRAFEDKVRQITDRSPCPSVP